MLERFVKKMLTKPYRNYEATVGNLHVLLETHGLTVLEDSNISRYVRVFLPSGIRTIIGTWLVRTCTPPGTTTYIMIARVMLGI